MDKLVKLKGEKEPAVNLITVSGELPAAVPVSDFFNEVVDFLEMSGETNSSAVATAAKLHSFGATSRAELARSAGQPPDMEQFRRTMLGEGFQLGIILFLWDGFVAPSAKAPTTGKPTTGTPSTGTLTICAPTAQQMTRPGASRPVENRPTDRANSCCDCDCCCSAVTTDRRSDRDDIFFYWYLWHIFQRPDSHGSSSDNTSDSCNGCGCDGCDGCDCDGCDGCDCDGCDGCDCD
jgi:hypothetical protein